MPIENNNKYSWFFFLLINYCLNKKKVLLLKNNNVVKYLILTVTDVTIYNIRWKVQILCISWIDFCITIWVYLVYRSIPPYKPILLLPQYIIEVFQFILFYYTFFHLIPGLLKRLFLIVCSNGVFHVYSSQSLFDDL